MLTTGKLLKMKAKNCIFIEGTTHSTAVLAQQAVAEYAPILRANFSNLVAISATVRECSNPEEYGVVLYVEDDKIADFPMVMSVRDAVGKRQEVPVSLIPNTGKSCVHIGNSDSVADSKTPANLGSICCLVKSVNNPDFLGLVTAAHICTNGKFEEGGNFVLNPDEQQAVLVGGIPVGKWFYKELTETQDLCIARLDKHEIPAQGLKTFANQYHVITEQDIGSSLTILAQNNKETLAYILDVGIGYPVKYSNGTFYKKNIILVGSVPDRIHSQPVSEPGDSGACVYMSVNGTDKLVGILLGGDEHFTFVLPIQTTLTPDFTII